MLTFFDKEKRDISRQMEEPTEFCDNPTCLENLGLAPGKQVVK